MITAKARKPTSQQSQPTREDYAGPEQQKKSAAPLAFMLFLTGCAAYLKSFMPIRVEAGDAPQKSSKHDDAAESAARIDNDIRVLEDDAAKDSAHGTNKSSSAAVPIRIVLPQESDSAATGGSPSGRAAPAASLRLASAEAVPAANDDPSTGPAHSGGRDSGAGGGGGGGGSASGGGHDGIDHRTPLIPPEPVRNRAPRTSGPVHLQDAVGCQVMMISMLALLVGTIDPDGDRLSITRVSSTSGTLTPTEDGGWMFVRDPGMLGEVTLTYTISDGRSSIVQTAYFNVVEAPPIVGTAGDDNLLGTHCADAIDGGAGDDNIDAREGNDTIIGGVGDDHIIAGTGNDVVYAGAGDDLVFAGSGNDTVFGGSGNDRLFGEDGNDTILGEDGNDLISGGPGIDVLIAGAGNDTLEGDAGNDTLEGGDGNDRLAGGAGNDVMTADAGDDHLRGEDGNDVLSDGPGRDVVDAGSGADHVIAAADADDDVYDGGAGPDTLDYSTASRRLTADLGNGTVDGIETGHDVVAGFEKVIGGSGDDHIIAGPSAVSMIGGAGNDTLEGGAGNDAFDGGAGNDVIRDGTGSDIADAGDGDDHVLAAADAADDCYDGGAGQDRLDYSTATLNITVDLGNGTADGADIGHDLIESFEELVAGSGDDHLIAGSNSVSMTGGDGNDTFEFQRTESDPQLMTVRRITDFTVGDRIVAATYEITYFLEDGAENPISDMFDNIYLSGSGHGHNRPVRFRFEEVENDKLTLVEVLERPDSENFFTIEVVGHHHLQFTAA